VIDLWGEGFTAGFFKISLHIKRSTENTFCVSLFGVSACITDSFFGEFGSNPAGLSWSQGFK